MGLLRVFLALAVIATHSSAPLGYQFINGFMAVQLFFIVSGFYMALILETKYDPTSQKYLFYSNRALRIFPIYWSTLASVLIFCLFSWLIINSPFLLGYWQEKFEYLSIDQILTLVFSNIFLFGQEILSTFLTLPNQGGDFQFTTNFWAEETQMYRFLLIPQAWTLSLELMFYLIAPFIVRHKIPVILILIAISLIIRIILSDQYNLSRDPWSYRFFPSELALFLFGVLAYKSAPLFNRISNIWLIITTIAFLVLLVTFRYIPAHYIPSFMSKKWLLYTLAIPAIYTIFNITRKLKWDNKIGELSYPIYIVHLFIIELLRIALPTIGAIQHIGALAIITSIIFAIVLNFAITSPIERLRQRRYQTITPKLSILK